MKQIIHTNGSSVGPKYQLAFPVVKEFTSCDSVSHMNEHQFNFGIFDTSSSWDKILKLHDPFAFPWQTSVKNRTMKFFFEPIPVIIVSQYQLR